MRPILRRWMLAPALTLLAATAYAQAPVIKSVSVNYPSRQLIITGSNFGATPTVTLGGTALTATITDAVLQRMTATVPATGFPAANYSLVVANGSGGTSFNVFYGPAPLTWKGTWVSTTTYAQNDAVVWNGGVYLSRLTNCNRQPDTHPSEWNVLSPPPAAPPHTISLVAQGGLDTGMVQVLGLRYIIAIGGIFPANGGTSTGYSDVILGEIRMFAGNFAPSGFMFCEGQLLPIQNNQALFSLLGTQYGGDGKTTFALPDLRATAVVHANN
ncbi:MAG TPA: tail fiber protein [Holophagaceae bacterium]|nr:tail fiber protein [Holophagaceae bacterium]